LPQYICICNFTGLSKDTAFSHIFFVAESVRSEVEKNVKIVIKNLPLVLDRAWTVGPGLPEAPASNTPTQRVGLNLSLWICQF